jgi:hypothetical protein
VPLARNPRSGKSTREARKLSVLIMRCCSCGNPRLARYRQINISVIGLKNVATSDLLKPYDARQMRCYPVSNRVNHVANDDQAVHCARGTSRGSESALFVVVSLATRF